MPVKYYNTCYRAIPITIDIELPIKRRVLANITDSPVLNKYITNNIAYLLALNLLSSILRD